jgi:hypothetical protein
MPNFLSQIFKVLYIVSSSKLHIYQWLWVSNMFSLTCSNSILRFESSYNVLDQDVAFWATCSKNMLICLKVFVKWQVTRTCWNLKIVDFPFVLGSTTSWTSWNDFVVTVVGSVMRTTSLVNVIGSFWMLVITWSKLGSRPSLILCCVAMASSFSPPPFEQVCSSSSSKSLTDDPKVILAFFLGGEATSSRLNLSLSVGGYVHIFSWWD